MSYLWDASGMWVLIMAGGLTHGKHYSLTSRVPLGGIANLHAWFQLGSTRAAQFKVPRVSPKSLHRGIPNFNCRKQLVVQSRP